MLFNSREFLFLFLPVVFFCCLLLGLLPWRWPRMLFLLAASLFFYAYWKVPYLGLLGGSIIFNYGIGRAMMRFEGQKLSKWLLGFGVVVNLACLGYFKYINFAIDNINQVLGTNMELLHVILPLAISFFTFQQIAFLADTCAGKIRPGSFTEYSLFVSFFPQLIAGPIVHYQDVSEQLKQPKVPLGYIYTGLILIAVGLFKKSVLGDAFGYWSDQGFAHPETLDTLNAWAATLCFSLQIYFDFSGYTDIALGLGLLFGIRLPLNFDSPYLAKDVQDFWRRWHMTLGRFLRDYLYIPLGGNRLGLKRTIFNICLVFFIAGLWHGANWTFVLWGVLQGLGLTWCTLWSRVGRPMPRPLAIFLTFLFISLTWVIFRVQTLPDALQVYQALFDFHGFSGEAVSTFLNMPLDEGFSLSESLKYYGPLGTHGGFLLFLLACGLCIVYLPMNTNRIFDAEKPSWFLTAGGAFCMVAGSLALISGTVQTFLYFQF